MTDSELRQLAEAASEVLRPHLERSEALRRAVGLIGKWLCEEAERTASAVGSNIATIPTDQIEATGPSPTSPSLESGSTEGNEASARPAAAPAIFPPQLPVSCELVPLRLGDAEVHVSMSGTIEELGRARQAAFESKTILDNAGLGFSGGDASDLFLVETRCRLKAASCRLAITRRAAAAGDDAEYETRQQMNQMIAKAKAMLNCYLWVFARERPQLSDAALAQIAENYDAHADAVSLMRRIDESEEGARSAECVTAFHLLAEANSALRHALLNTWLTEDDGDQADIHHWLRQETALRRVFIDRHMTASDPADPSNAAALRARTKEVNTRLDGRVLRAKGVKNALNQIRFHARQIVKHGSADAAGDWDRIADTVAKLSGMGVSSTDRRIAEAVGTEAACLWPDWASDQDGMSVVIERVKTLAAITDADTTTDELNKAREWSEAVLEVRQLLCGKQIVVIGGERNGEAVERFIQAFRLTDAAWVALIEHGPSVQARAPIFRSDTAVVLVIVKLTGHLHVDAARAFATSAGKPLVLLTGGYNPEQVAKAILEQASTRLKQ